MPARVGALTMLRSHRWVLPALLALAVVLVYSPSLPGDLLNLDDPWLIRDNTLLRGDGLRGLLAIWTDFSRGTRLALGAEYLPLRDTSHWLELHTFGLLPQAMRTVQLALYVAAVLAFRGALRRALGAGTWAEVAAWLFALHPLHVESVAWLAGRKDVLALLFVGLALYAYAGQGRHRTVSVPVLLACATLSKSMSIAAVGLLPVMDLMARRRASWRVLAVSVIAVASLLPLHLHVGSVVGMTTPPPGGSRWTAAATMGPVWLRYMLTSVWAADASIVREVTTRTGWDSIALGGWVAVLVTLGACLWAWRRHGRVMPMAGWLWFFVPLAPVSQVLISLQNRMADRYLFLSLMAPCLMMGWVAERFPKRGWLLVAPWGLLWSLHTVHRAVLFSDSVLVFDDATRKTTWAAMPPYQLAQAWEERGETALAKAAYQEALRRAPGSEEVARRSTNNLARLLVRQGELAEARFWLSRGAQLWPDDAKVAGNLAEVLALQGQHEQARSMCADLLRRFPEYTWGVENCTRRYGPDLRR